LIFRAGLAASVMTRQTWVQCDKAMLETAFETDAMQVAVDLQEGFLIDAGRLRCASSGFRQGSGRRGIVADSVLKR